MTHNQKILLMTFAVVLVYLAAAPEEITATSSAHFRRHKRSLPDLSDMIRAVLKTRSGLDYIGYGNYCGIGGAGTPLDAIDTCCQHHDECYHRITVEGACARERGFKKDLLHYQWHLDPNDSTVSCDLPRHNRSATACKHGLCTCDTVIVKCFQDNDHNYSVSNSRHRTLGGELWQKLRDRLHKNNMRHHPITEISKQPNSGETTHDLDEVRHETGFNNGSGELPKS